jgi:hypothetical protein
VEICTKLLQDDPEPGNFQTIPDDKRADHEWDGDSPMTCEGCGHAGTADDFYREAADTSQVYLLVLNLGGGGTRTSLHASHESAKSSLMGFVSERWSDYNVTRPSPDLKGPARDKAIKKHFDQGGGLAYRWNITALVNPHAEPEKSPIIGMLHNGVFDICSDLPEDGFILRDYDSVEEETSSTPGSGRIHHDETGCAYVLRVFGRGSS